MLKQITSLLKSKNVLFFLLMLFVILFMGNFQIALASGNLTVNVRCGTKGLQGLTVHAGGNSRITDVNGVATFNNLPNGWYSITINSSEYYNFSNDGNININNNNLTYNYTATFEQYRIRGYVYYPDNSPWGNLTVNISGYVNSSTTTSNVGNTGRYTFNNLDAIDPVNFPTSIYNISPSPQWGYNFTTTWVLPVTDFHANMNNVNFYASYTPVTLTGSVITTDGSHPLLGNITVRLYRSDGTYLRNTTTDASGNYSFSGPDVLAWGTYYVRFYQNDNTGIRFRVNNTDSYTTTGGYKQSPTLNVNSSSSVTFAQIQVGAIPLSFNGLVLRNGDGFAGIKVIMDHNNSTFPDGTPYTSDVVVTSRPWDGLYVFMNSDPNQSLYYGGTYRIAPAVSAVATFSPTERIYNPLTTAQNQQNFDVMVHEVTLSGALLAYADNSHPDLSGVRVNLYRSDGVFINSTSTLSDGTYSFPNMAVFNAYYITFSTADNPGLRFRAQGDTDWVTPTKRSANIFVNFLEIFTFENIYAGAVPITISGAAIDADNGGFLSGVRLYIDETRSTFPDGASFSPRAYSSPDPTTSDGQYSFTVPSGGNYYIVPGKSGYTFKPGEKQFSSPTINQTWPFIGSSGSGSTNTYTISGYIRNNSGTGINGLMITIGGGMQGMYQTRNGGSPAADGYYEFIVIAGGSYNLSFAQGQGYDFNPGTQSFPNVNSNQTQNFIATVHQYRISGNITSAPDGNIIRNVNINGIPSANTGTSGAYTSSSINALADYTFSPVKTGYTFTPINMTLFHLVNNTNGFIFAGNNFTGSLTYPTLNLPANAAADQSLRPRLSWNPSIGAGSYIVEYSTDPGFPAGPNTISAQVSGGTSSYYDIPNDLQYNQDYYWHVRAKDQDATAGESGPLSPWSGIRFFTIRHQRPDPPSLVSPVISAPKIALLPEFNWNAGLRATSYTIQIRESGTGIVILNHTTGNTNTGYQYSGVALKPLTNYEWRVGSWNSGCADANDIVWDLEGWRSFTTYTPVPILTSSGGGTDNGGENISTLSVTLNWTPGSPSNPLPNEYDIEISTTSTFDAGTFKFQGVYSGAGIFPAVITPSTPFNYNTTYFWRVRAKKTSLPVDVSEWSTVWTFTTIVDKPAAPVLVYPGIDETKILTTTTFSWNAADRATEYRIQVRIGSQNGLTVINQPILNGATTYSGNLSPTTIYYWRVGSWNAACSFPGDTVWSSAWSSARKFTTSIIAPQLQANIGLPPTIDNGATNQPLTNIPLGWNNGGTTVNPDFYHLQINDKSDFTGTMIINNNTLSYDAGNDPYRYIYSGTNLQYGKTYYWRVSALKGTDESGWSAVWSFATIVNKPDAPALLTPEPNAIKISTIPTFSWSSGARATEYRIQVREGSPNGLTVINQSIPDASTTYKVLAALKSTTNYYWRVGSWNIGCLNPSDTAWSSDWNNSRLFTTSITVPVPTAGINGIDGYGPTISNGATSQPLNNVPIGWSRGGAFSPDKYHLQLSDRSDFTGTVIFNNNNINYTQDPFRYIYSGAPLSNGKTYYWRVSSIKGTDESAWSDVWSFTTIIAKPDPPVLTTPSPNEKEIPTSPILLWSSANRATEYRVQIREGSPTGKTVLDRPIPDASTSYQVTPALKPTTVYYWRVGSWNVGCLVPADTAWDLEGWRQFTTSLPVPVPKSDGGTANGVPVSAIINIPLNWDPGTPATPPPDGYIVEVSTKSTFDAGSIAFTGSSIQGPINITATLNYNMTYYWHVKATRNNPPDESEWSVVWSFITGLSKPSLTSPVNHATTETRPTLTWVLVPGASSYRVQYANNPSFINSTTADISAGTYTFPTSFENNTSIFWRVQAINTISGIQYFSVWSDIWDFTTNLSIPNLRSPANLAILNNTSPQLVWDIVPGAISYDIEYNTSPTFAGGTGGSTTLIGNSNTSWPLSNLNTNMVYFWHVRGTNGSGAKSNWSSTWTFTTGLAAPVIISPINNVTVSSTPTFIWNTSVGATDYYLEISRDATFQIQAERVYPGPSDPPLKGTSWTVPENNPLPAARFWWRVRANNSGGNSDFSQHSDPSFTTSTLIPQLIAPANGLFGVLSDVEFQWGSVNAASSYTLQICKESKFRDDPIIISNISDVKRLVTGLDRKTTYYWRVSAIVNGADTWSVTWSFRTAGALIAIDNNILNFDSTVIGKPRTKTFVIINSGSEPLLIPKLVITGDDAGNFNSPDVSVNNITIPVNGRRTITVNFAPVISGNISAKLEIYHNDASADNNPILVSLSGTGIRTMARLVLQSPLNFGQQFLASDPKDSILVITNTSSIPGDQLTLNSAYFENRNNVFQITDGFPIFISPGMSYKLKVRFNPILTGLLTNTLHLVNSSLNPDAACAILGTVKEGNLVIRPTSIDYNNTTIAKPYKDSIIELINYGLTPITIINKSIKGDTDAFKFIKNTNNLTLPTGKTDTTIVRFYPHNIAGRKNGIVEILTSDPLASKRTVTLTGVAGDNPVIFIEPTTIDFDALAKSAIKDTVIQIRNDGSLDLYIFGMTFTGPNAELFSIISGSGIKVLKTGESAKIRIRATGRMPIGSKSARFEVISNDPNHPTIGVNFSFIVRTPSFWKSLDRIVWDTVLVKYCVDSVFTIGNAGNMSMIVKSMTLDGPNAADFKITGVTTPFELKPDSTKNLYVKYCPTAGGNRYASLLIQTDDPSALESRVVFRGNTFLINPELVTDTLIDFGKIAPLEQSKKDITLTNASKLVRMIIDSIKLVNPDGQYYSQFSKMTPYIIEKSTSYKFSLSFYAPSNIKKYPVGWLWIYYDNPARSPFKVKLNGTVTMPKITFELEPVIRFMKVPVDSSKTISFNLLNSGDADLNINNATLNGSDAAEFSINTKFPFVIMPSEKKIFSVTFTPKKLGNKDVSIKLIWNDIFNDGIIYIWAEGISKGAGTLSIKNREIPKEYGLSQNYPNPFNPSTRIEYALPKATTVTIKVYNSIGQEVATLVNTEMQQAGYYQLEWNPHYLSSGIYYYRIQADKFTSLKKMLFIK